MKEAEIQQLIAREIETLIDREGGYVNHPNDRGGPTCWGVTAAVARTAGYRGPMADMPRELARRIYRERYWEGPGFGKVAVRAPMVAAELFDTGVNMGPATAIGFLQRALNALNRRAIDWPDLPPTRSIDPATLAAIDALLAIRGRAGEGVLVKALDALQGARYIELAEARPANESFTYGWLAKRVG